jgi:RHS repeat-associated protein
MPGRSIGNDFAYNFNGKRTDKRNGDNGSYLDFGARIRDARLGRFFTLDPKAGFYPNYSPYLFAGNNPISFVDEEGEGPRFSNVTKVFEKQLKKLVESGAISSFKKFDFEDAGKIVFVANKILNGQSVSVMYEFNDKDSDSDYERILTNYGVNLPEAVCATSNSLKERIYWTAKAKDEYYEKPENGIPLVFKTWATILTFGNAAAIEGGIVGLGALETGLWTVDGVFILDDISSIFSVSNMTFLEKLAEKAGIDPSRIETAKNYNDLIQGLNDLKNIVKDINSRFNELGIADKSPQVIEMLDFMQGQIDMHKHYWDRMIKDREAMKDNLKKNKGSSKVKKSESIPSY